jgi:hypothetical protein
VTARNGEFIVIISLSLVQMLMYTEYFMDIRRMLQGHTISANNFRKFIIIASPNPGVRIPL